MICKQDLKISSKVFSIVGITRFTSIYFRSSFYANFSASSVVTKSSIWLKTVMGRRSVLHPISNFTVSSGQFSSSLWIYFSKFSNVSRRVTSYRMRAQCARRKYWTVRFLYNSYPYESHIYILYFVPSFMTVLVFKSRLELRGLLKDNAFIFFLRLPPVSGNIWFVAASVENEWLLFSPKAAVRRIDSARFYIGDGSFSFASACIKLVLPTFESPTMITFKTCAVVVWVSG